MSTGKVKNDKATEETLQEEKLSYCQFVHLSICPLAKCSHIGSDSNE